MKIPAKQLKEFADRLNREFGQPFLPGGLFKARILSDGSLEIRIDRREIVLDNELELIGSGTYLG